MEEQQVKRTKFTPSNIEQMESDTYAQLCGTEDRYKVPDDFKGKELSDWDKLTTAFPVPSLNYRGCPLFYTTMGCGCQNCIDMQDSYVPYAHRIMHDIELDGVPTPGKARRNVDREIEYVVPNDITSAVSVIQDYVHVYSDYCVCSHSNVDRSTLNTPILTYVYLRDNSANEVRSEAIIRDAKWAVRAAMTPTRLSFKEKMD